MEDIFISLSGIFLAVSLLAIGLIIGRFNEKRHYRSIHERERNFLEIPTTDLKHVPEVEKVEEAVMVHGSVVISIDYFKRFVAGIKKIFGGELRTYSSLLDRARREAMLRMKESYPDADTYVNCRIETTSISQGRKKTIGSIEVLVYGTAVRYRR